MGNHDPEPDPIDTLAVMRAEIDQMVAIMPELARACKAWFDTFKNEGFSEKQALYLAAAQMVSKPGEPPA